MNQKYLSDFPELIKQIHPKNGAVDPSKIKRGTAKELWWICNEGHEWKAPILRRTRGNGCPFCSGRNPTNKNCLSNNESISKEWNIVKNNLTTDEVCLSSGKKFWWICTKGHEWQDTPDHRSKGRGCPMCNRRRPSPEINLERFYPEVAKEWCYERNTIKPNEILPMSTKKFWWICTKGHKYQSKVLSRTLGAGCSICSGRVVTQDNCLAILRPEIAKEWHPTKNTFTPNEVTVGSDKKVWWQCLKFPQHQWESSICSRTRQKNTNCRYCRLSKGEKSIEEWLINNNILYKRQFKFDNCINKRKLAFDFAIFTPEVKLIEFQGEQHFKAITYWGGENAFQVIKMLDNIKKDFCIKENIPLLLISFQEKQNIFEILNKWIKN